MNGTKPPRHDEDDFGPEDIPADETDPATHVTVPSAADTGPLCRASILLPGAGACVPKSFAFQVRIECPQSTKYYYLAHEVGGRFWPKANIRPQSGGGVVGGTSNEYGDPPGGLFRIVLLEVDQAQHEVIEAWFRGSDWSGFKITGRTLATQQARLA